MKVKFSLLKHALSPPQVLDSIKQAWKVEGCISTPTNSSSKDGRTSGKFQEFSVNLSKWKALGIFDPVSLNADEIPVNPRPDCVTS